MNVKIFKDAVALKCRQCVGPWSNKYNASPAELIDVCDKKTCGLYKVRPRIAKVGQEEEFLSSLKEIINEL
jgi:hypothetical protein